MGLRATYPIVTLLLVLGCGELSPAPSAANDAAAASPKDGLSDAAADPADGSPADAAGAGDASGGDAGDGDADDGDAGDSSPPADAALADLSPTLDAATSTDDATDAAPASPDSANDDGVAATDGAAATESDGEAGSTGAQPDADVALSDGAADGGLVGDDSTQDGVVDAANLSGDATATSCAPAKELCDGVDNDCDGLTDEDFTLKLPTSAKVLKLGQSCANPMCPGGTVVCDSVKYAWCDTCPKNVTLGAQLAAKGAKKSPLKATGGFADVSAQLPLQAMVPLLGSPVDVPAGISGMAIDVDGDGDLDLVWVHGGKTVTLMTQTTPWNYSAKVVLKSKTSISVLAATDRDGDGIPELVLGGDGLMVLERQQDGGYDKSPVNSALQLPQNNDQVQHLLSADVNGDGLLDLVVGLFSCQASAQALQVFINRGGQTYDEQSVALGLGLQASAWAVLASDYNGDGRLDLLVLTESCAPMTGVALYLGQADAKAGTSATPRYKLSQQTGIFTAPKGPAKGSPMGAAAADVNGDGVLDYLLSEIELRGFEQFGSVKQLDPLNPALHGEVSNTYLLSQPSGKRTSAGLEAGLWAPLSASGKTMVAWSPVWADLDHDGHLDLLLSHGYDYGAWVMADQGGMRPVAFRHDGTGHFVDVSKSWGLPAKHATRAMVASDLDGDGDLDLVMGGQAVGARVYRNDIQHGGQDVRLRLIGTTSNVWGLGARVALHTTQRVLHAEMGAVAASQTMATPALHFALRAQEEATKVVVTWPTGWQGTTKLVAAPAPGKTPPKLSPGLATLGKGGWLTLTEPALITLSTRWSPAGAVPVTITAVDRGADGQTKPGSQGCTITIDGGVTGGFAAATTCQGATCTRVWQGPAKAGTEVVFAITCGAQAWSVRPRVYL